MLKMFNSLLKGSKLKDLQSGSPEYTDYSLILKLIVGDHIFKLRMF